MSAAHELNIPLGSSAGLCSCMPVFDWWNDGLRSDASLSVRHFLCYIPNIPTFFKPVQHISCYFDVFWSRRNTCKTVNMNTWIMCTRNLRWYDIDSSSMFYSFFFFINVSTLNKRDQIKVKMYRFTLSSCSVYIQRIHFILWSCTHIGFF